MGSGVGIEVRGVATGVSVTDRTCMLCRMAAGVACPPPRLTARAVRVLSGVRVQKHAGNFGTFEAERAQTPEADKSAWGASTRPNAS